MGDGLSPVLLQKCFVTSKGKGVKDVECVQNAREGGFERVEKRQMEREDQSVLLMKE